MAGKAPTKEAASNAPKTEEALRREAYGAATARLRESRKDEFRAFVQEEAAKRGVRYEFRKTPEERAREQMQALLAEHPNLAVEFSHQQGDRMDEGTHLDDVVPPQDGQPEQG